MRYAGVLFDLDGTLLDTLPDLAAAINAMRRDMGMPPLTATTVARYVGGGNERLVARALGHNDSAIDVGTLRAAFQRFREHYRAVNGRECRVYPGVVEGLQAFRQLGARLAVVTNKSSEFTRPLLERMKLGRYFDAIVCGDTCTRRKPDPEPLLHACRLMGVPTDNALCIGDSVNDALAARAAGIPMLAVPYGYNEGRPASELPAMAVVESVFAAARWASGSGTVSAQA